MARFHIAMAVLGLLALGGVQSAQEKVTEQSVKDLPAVGDLTSGILDSDVPGIVKHVTGLADSDIPDVSGLIDSEMPTKDGIDSDIPNVKKLIAATTGSSDLPDGSAGSDFISFADKTKDKAMDSDIPFMAQGKLQDSDIPFLKYGEDLGSSDIPIIGKKKYTDSDIPLVGSFSESDIPFFGDGKQIGSSSTGTDGDGSEVSVLFTMVAVVGVVAVVVALVSAVNRKRQLVLDSEKSKLLPQETTVTSSNNYGTTLDRAAANL
jgi:hypothetical protein